MNPRHCGSDPVDVWIRIVINLEIQIESRITFGCRFSRGRVCAPWMLSLWHLLPLQHYGSCCCRDTFRRDCQCLYHRVTTFTRCQHPALGHGSRFAVCDITRYDMLWVWHQQHGIFGDQSFTAHQVFGTVHIGLCSWHVAVWEHLRQVSEDKLDHGTFALVPLTL